MEPIHLGGGVVIFKNAIDINQDSVITHLESLKAKAREEMFTYVYDEEGVPLHVVNQGGFIYEIDDIEKSPVRMMHGLDPVFSQECEDAVYKALLMYVEMFPAILHCLWWRSTGHVLAYDKGAKLGLHSDNDVNYRYGAEPQMQHATRNVLSALVYLNDCTDDGEEIKPNSFSGGHMSIPYFDIDIKPEKGMICMMPANYLGAHEIFEVTRGTRYSYLGWFAQGSADPDRGVKPFEDKETMAMGNQLWLKTIIEDYKEYIDSKYAVGSAPESLTLFNSRKKDHVNEGQ
jgi:hypothetical protein